MSVPVSVSRSWNVTCTETGAHQFAVDASAEFSSGQSFTDPNLANNANNGTAITQVN